MPGLWQAVHAPQVLSAALARAHGHHHVLGVRPCFRQKDASQLSHQEQASRAGWPDLASKLAGPVRYEYGSTGLISVAMVGFVTEGRLV